MALLHDATTKQDSSGYQNSVTVSHTRGTGASDYGASVKVSCRTASADISGVTYDGNAMALEDTSENTNVCGVQLHSYINPPSGAANVVVSLNNYRLSTVVVSTYSGANQTDLIEAIQKSTGYSANPSISVTTLTDGAFVENSINLQSAKTITNDNGTVINNSDHSDGSLGQTGVSYTSKVSAGAQSTGWSYTGGDNWAMIAASIKPAAGAASNTKTFTCDGIVKGTTTKTFTVDGFIVGPEQKGLYFDGTGDYVSIPFGKLTGNATRTIELKFWTLSSTNSQLLSWGVAAANELSSIGIFSSQIGYAGYTNDLLYSISGYNDGNWHTLSVTFNGTTMYLHLDGVKVAEKATTLDTGESVLEIGKLIGATDNFTGAIDEVRISDNARYTSSNYTPSTAEFESDANTLILLHFNEGSGTEVLDSSPNAEIGTLYGDTTFITGYHFTNDILNTKKTFTVDGIVSEGSSEQTKTFTCDAIVKEINTKTFTCDGIVKEINTKTFTTDGIVKEINTKTFTTDGIVFAQNTKTFTVDGIVKEINTKTFTTDGIVFAKNTKTFTCDGIVKEVNTKTFTTDGVVLAQQTKTFTVDGIVKEINTKTFTIDAIVSDIKVKTFTVDGIVKAQQTKTFTTDGIVISRNQKTFTVDSIIKEINTVTFTTDGIVKEINTKTFTIDGVIEEANTKTFTVDGIVLAQQTKTFTIDGVIEEANTTTFTIDGIVLAQQTKTFTIDAIIKETNIITFTTDGIVKEVNTETFTTDGIIKEINTITFTVDAIIKQANIVTFTVDAIVKEEKQKTFTIDAIVLSQQLKTFTIDGFIISQEIKTFTIDAIVKETNTVTFTVDAVVTKIYSKDWFDKNNTIYQSKQNTDWFDKNNTNYKDKNNTDWFDKNNTDWN